MPKCHNVRTLWNFGILRGHDDAVWLYTWCHNVGFRDYDLADCKSYFIVNISLVKKANTLTVTHGLPLSQTPAPLLSYLEETTLIKTNALQLCQTATPPESQFEACACEIFLCTRFSPCYLWISSEWWSVSTCVRTGCPRTAVDYSVNEIVTIVSCETFPLLTAARREGNVNITETYMSILAGNIGWGSKSNISSALWIKSYAVALWHPSRPRWCGMLICMMPYCRLPRLRLRQICLWQIVGAILP